MMFNEIKSYTEKVVAKLRGIDTTRSAASNQLSAHIADKNNPHRLTPADIDSLSKSEVDSLISKTDPIPQFGGFNKLVGEPDGGNSLLGFFVPANHYLSSTPYQDPATGESNGAIPPDLTPRQTGVVIEYVKLSDVPAEANTTPIGSVGGINNQIVHIKLPNGWDEETDSKHTWFPGNPVSGRVYVGFVWVYVVSGKMGGISKFSPDIHEYRTQNGNNIPIEAGQTGHILINLNRLDYPGDVNIPLMGSSGGEYYVYGPIFGPGDGRFPMRMPVPCSGDALHNIEPTDYWKILSAEVLNQSTYDAMKSGTRYIGSAMSRVPSDDLLSKPIAGTTQHDTVFLVDIGDTITYENKVITKTVERGWYTWWGNIYHNGSDYRLDMKITKWNYLLHTKTTTTKHNLGLHIVVDGVTIYNSAVVAGGKFTFAVPNGKTWSIEQIESSTEDLDSSTTTNRITVQGPNTMHSKHYNYSPGYDANTLLDPQMNQLTAAKKKEIESKPPVVSGDTASVVVQEVNKEETW